MLLSTIVFPNVSPLSVLALNTDINTPVYNPNFLEMYKEIVNKVDQENISFLLVRLLEGLFRELNHSKEGIVKQMAPQTNIDFICLECGLNHEVRDFIRAVLIHLIDQLEMSNDFLKFLKSKDFLNDDVYGELQNVVNDHVVSWKTKKKLVTIRILPVTKGTGTVFGRLLAINKEGKIGYGMFDNTLVGIICPEVIAESYPSILDVCSVAFFILHFMESTILQL